MRLEKKTGVANSLATPVYFISTDEQNLTATPVYLEPPKSLLVVPVEVAGGSV